MSYNAKKIESIRLEDIMKKSFITVISILLIGIFVLSGCDSDSSGTIETETQTQVATRVYTEPDEQNTSIGSIYVSDNSWTGNYKLTYNYADTGTASKITEIRCEGLYKAIDEANGMVSYFEEVEGGIDEFAINTVTNKAAHTFLANQDMATLTSGFMRVSAIESDFAQSNDVIKEGTEEIVGRICDRYLKSIYTNGTLTAYAFVWVDQEYGFVSKCAVYTVQNSLYSSWELLAFETGTVKPEDVFVDMTAYSITEAEETEQGN
jgi:hypothetical protein